MKGMRKAPHDPSLFESEDWRWFWMGKSPRVKKATREYMENYGTQNPIPQWQTAEKNNVTEASIIQNITKMRATGLIEDLRHQSVFGSRSKYK